MKTIMVIDMCPHALSLTGCYLERNGYRPMQIEDPAEAAMTILTEQPHLVVLGCDELCYNDLELVTMVRTWEQTASLPWILSTAHVGATRQQVGASVPIDGYLPRPLREVELMAEIKRVLSEPVRPAKPGTVYLPPQNVFGEKPTGFWPKERKTRRLPTIAQHFSSYNTERAVR